MGLNFQPKSEDEIKETNLAPDGDYGFEVLAAEDAVSAKGNPMISTKIGIYYGDQIRWHVYDYLLAQMEAKLRHFCDTTGLLAKYESGNLCAADCVGRSGKCRIKVKPGDGKYPPKNVVGDYVVRAAKPLSPAVTNPGPPEDDDVPF